MKDKLIYLVTTCKKDLNLKESSWYECHFRGYYLGHFIKKVRVKKSAKMEVDKEYIIKAKVGQVDGLTLYVDPISIVDLDDHYFTY